MPAFWQPGAVSWSPLLVADLLLEWTKTRVAAPVVVAGHARGVIARAAA
jgi:hypothetical protein